MLKNLLIIVLIIACTYLYIENVRLNDEIINHVICTQEELY